MRLALREAERAAEHGDVPIGAVVVHEGEVVGAAGNERELRGGPDGARGDPRPARGGEAPGRLAGRPTRSST